MDGFDVHDMNSWYFGSLSRPEATEILMNERERGVFLVRDSKSILGDFVLCVREDTKVSNYIINKIQQHDQVIFRIGDQAFEDLPKLLTFYTLHYLDTTPLRRPVVKRLEKVIGKFDFDGTDQDDLPFRRGEVLTIIRKDEDQWWTARNSIGKMGQVPVPYIQKYEEANELTEPSSRKSTSSSEFDANGVTFRRQRSSCELTHHHSHGAQHQHSSEPLQKSDMNRKLPSYARVKQARVPNAYDKTALKLEVGDIIKVTKININGQWEGELKGKKGHFPFTHIEFTDDICTDHHCNAKDWGE